MNRPSFLILAAIAVTISATLVFPAQADLNLNTNACFRLHGIFGGKASNLLLGSFVDTF